MSEQWGVLLFERSERARNFAGDIARVAGLVRYDVLQGLRDERSYILDFMDGDRAGRVASALSERGLAAVALPQSAFDFSFGAGVVRDGSLDENGMSVRNLVTGAESTVSWNTLRGVLVLHRKAAPKPPPRPKRNPHHVDGSLAGGMYGLSKGLSDISSASTSSLSALLGGDGDDGFIPSPFQDNPLRDLIGGALGDFIFVDRSGKLSDDTARRALEAMARNGVLRGGEDDMVLLLLGEDPMVVSAIERSGFNYGYLGERRGLSSMKNFQEVLTDVARLARPFYCNKPFITSVKEGSIRRFEKVRGGFIDRWLKEYIIMINLLWSGRVPESVLGAMDSEECLMLYLE